MINKINTIDDVKAFFRLLPDEGLNFHPDTPLVDYIHVDTRQPTYTVEEAQLRDELMNPCFAVCETINIDIYELSYEMFLDYKLVESLKKVRCEFKNQINRPSDMQWDISKTIPIKKSFSWKNQVYNRRA